MAGVGDPYEGTEVSDLLDELPELEDEEEIAALIEQLLELLGEYASDWFPAFAGMTRLEAARYQRARARLCI